MLLWSPQPLSMHWYTNMHANKTAHIHTKHMSESERTQNSMDVYGRMLGSHIERVDGESMNL